MKTKHYLVTLLLLLVIGFGALGVYYTQDFSEEIMFKDSITIADIEYSSEPRSIYNSGNDLGQYQVLASAESNLGTLNLKNNGYLDWDYKIPKLIGCVEFKNSAVTYLQLDIGFENNFEGEIVIPKNNELTLNILGTYKGYTLAIEEMKFENILSLEIYELEKKNLNPLIQNYDYNYYGYGYTSQNLCPNLVLEEEAIATIQII
ncbi:hypothetical protein HN604_03965 [archaeon]|jgi:hypothetical protein|nr:hypothetical protein [archaeon]MBT6182863.1 hypothetical protein [archaeon]MBT6606734.1 hypothetical protein [archaeon]MBT7251292.1 hypothetical protein [archaeon]MBT7661206.1 hypothetical protein [archaeon]